MINRFIVLAALCATGLFPLPDARAGQTESAKKLHKLLDESWDFSMREDPISATYYGDHRFNDQLPQVSVADSRRRLQVKLSFLRRLKNIDRSGLQREDQINYDIFSRLTRDSISESEFEMYLIPISNRSGFHISFPELGKRVPLKTVKDYENFITRLAAFDRYTQQHIDIMRVGINKEMTLPGVVMKGYRDSIQPHIVQDATKSLLYAPFTKMPSTFSKTDRERLEKAGRTAIKSSVVPGYQKFLDFMAKEYVPVCRGLIGASALPRGRAFYRHRVRKFTTLDLSPEQVHQTGLAEVKRIRAEMLTVIKRSGFKGDMPAFLKFLRTDPQFYAKTPEELFKETAYVLKKMDGQLPKLFNTLPRMPYGIRKVPDYIAPRTTTAYYSPPAGDGSDAGYYYINTYDLKSRPLYGIEALSLHEAVPGHHLQIALQQELENLHKFRRFAGFTVFVEGWALYAERLGLEVGFYQDPYSDFGRLTYEMWRACRLVVDTGMHYFGWSRQRAIDYLAENTALSMHNIVSEVDRYIAWPGQALAYKTGELRIRQLRKQAEEKLGSKFDVREFHRVVLGSGSIPLSVLDENIAIYIRRVAADKSKIDSPDRNSAIVYPSAHKGKTKEVYHGHTIADPYRWLEQPDSKQTREWIEQENRLTNRLIAQTDQRRWASRRLTQLYNYERYGVPTSRNGRYFFSKNSGLQNQSILVVADSLSGKPRVLIDPNKFSTDGTASLAGYRISDDGQLIAYGISRGGSDWREWKVRDVKTGKDTGDHLRWIKFSSVSWTPDGKGFYYSRYDAPMDKAVELTAENYHQKMYYHRIGEYQKQDDLVYQRSDQKRWGLSGSVTEDGRYLAIAVSRGTDQKNGFFYKDLKTPGAKVVELLHDFDAKYSFLGNDQSTFWFRTDSGAARNRIIAIDIKHPRREHWNEIVPEAKQTMQSVSVVGDRFFAIYMQDAHHVARVFDLSGKPCGQIELPGIGSIRGFRGKRKDSEMFYTFSGFTTPTSVYRYDIAKGRSELFRQPKVDFNPDDFVTRQVFYPSRDGTKIPMFITHKKGIRLDGTNPTLLYAYGGFNISILPRFSVRNIVWMEAGGVYAVANLRGGGEYGRAWHQAGRLGNKQNVFDDFIAAAKWLIDSKYTSRERLAIEGRSNGGLLVGACMTQRPELFGVALPGVGVMDMLRYQKFTIGWAWVPEYGSSDEPTQFTFLRKYSPLHNLRPGTKYPATLITTADHDDRVVPAHSFKFAATLQAAQADPAPVLIRIETRAGHGAGKPIAKRIAESADILGFTLHQMGVAAPR